MEKKFHKDQTILSYIKTSKDQRIYEQTLSVEKFHH